MKLKSSEQGWSDCYKENKDEIHTEGGGSHSRVVINNKFVHIFLNWAFLLRNCQILPVFQISSNFKFISELDPATSWIRPDPDPQHCVPVSIWWVNELMVLCRLGECWSHGDCEVLPLFHGEPRILPLNSHGASQKFLHSASRFKFRTYSFQKFFF